MSPRFAFTPLPPSPSEFRKPSALASLAGTWRGELRPDTGEPQPFTLIRDTSSDAAVAGRFLFFVTKAIAPTGVRLLEAANATFVALIGPYYDPREDAELVTVLEGTRRGDVLEGTYQTRWPGSRDIVSEGRFTAARTDSANRAA